MDRCMNGRTSKLPKRIEVDAVVYDAARASDEVKRRTSGARVNDGMMIDGEGEGERKEERKKVTDDAY